MSSQPSQPSPPGPPGPADAAVAKPPPPPKLSAKASRRPETIGEYYSRWDKQAKAMGAAANGVDWSGVDWSKLRASDVGVRMGPVLTEEQFKQLQASRGRQNIVARKTL